MEYYVPDRDAAAAGGGAAAASVAAPNAAFATVAGIVAAAVESVAEYGEGPVALSAVVVVVAVAVAAVTGWPEQTRAGFGAAHHSPCLDSSNLPGSAGLGAGPAAAQQSDQAARNRVPC